MEREGLTPLGDASAFNEEDSYGLRTDNLACRGAICEFWYRDVDEFPYLS